MVGFRVDFDALGDKNKWCPAYGGYPSPYHYRKWFLNPRDVSRLVWRCSYRRWDNTIILWIRCLLYRKDFSIKEHNILKIPISVTGKQSFASWQPLGLNKVREELDLYKFPFLTTSLNAGVIKERGCPDLSLFDVSLVSLKRFLVLYTNFFRLFRGIEIIYNSRTFSSFE